MNPKILFAKMIVSLLPESLAYRLRNDKDTMNATDTMFFSVGDVEDDRSLFHKQHYECGGKDHVIAAPASLPQKKSSDFDHNTLKYEFETCMVACHHKGASCAGFSFSSNNGLCILKSADCGGEGGDDDIKCPVGSKVSASGKQHMCGADDWVFWRRDGGESDGALTGCVVYYVTVSGTKTKECTTLTDGFPGDLHQIGDSQTCTTDSNNQCVLPSR
eukprot:TRINITY_DN13387_c0_g1_i1.p1 TRINITY_DN13387_c0_g1~~TRINITY_DN13387_c0_g1_i1.p1  ORF type:complete len:217 (-),score=13.03 TRINITY_DN13387_c0_g1_i1:54-704(-)